MENDLVKEVKRACREIESKISDAILDFKEKGIREKDLSGLNSLLGSTVMIRNTVKKGNVYECREELFNIQNEYEYEVETLGNMLHSVSATTLKKEYSVTQKEAINAYQKYSELGATIVELSPLAVLINKLTDNYMLIDDTNTYKMSLELDKIQSKIQAEEEKLKEKFVEPTVTYTTIPDEAEEEAKGTPVYVSNYEKVSDEELEEGRTYEATNEECKNKGWLKFWAGVLATLGILGLFKLAEKNKKDKADAANKTAVVEKSERDESSLVVLGAPGTFTDVTDSEQVEARAQYLIDNYYSKFYDKLDDNEKAQITKENIANTIRVMNGYCPLDADGNKLYYDTVEGNTVDDYGNKLLDFVGNIPSSKKMGTVEAVPAHLFAVDGSAAQEYIKIYDDLFAQIAEARNERNSDKYRSAATEVAKNYWFGWYLMGEPDYEGKTYANPWNTVSQTQKYLAYQTTVGRYSQYIKEAEFNQMAPICIDACVDYSTKQLEELSIAAIDTALEEGVWNDVIAKSAGMKVQTTPILAGFWESLADQLEHSYAHSDAKTLK